MVGSAAGERRGVGEEVGQPRDIGLDGASVLGHEAAGDRAGAGDADLLADDRTDRGLVAVDLTGDAQSRGGADEVTEHRVGGEVVVDRARVAVGVEQPAYALAGGRGVAQVLEPELGGDEAGPAAGAVEASGRSTSSRRTVPLPWGRSSVRAYQPGPATSTPGTRW